MHGPRSLALAAAAVSGLVLAAPAVAAPCEATPVHVDDEPPSWTDGWRPPPPTPWVEGQGAPIVGFLFTPPHAFPPGARKRSKILWVISRPPGGDALEIRGRRLGSNGGFRVRRPASLGWIYPSILPFRRGGCWRLDLRWGDDTARVVLEVADR